MLLSKAMAKLQWCDWIKKWAGAFSRFWGICIGLNWEKSEYIYDFLKDGFHSYDDLFEVSIKFIYINHIISLCICYLRNHCKSYLQGDYKIVVKEWGLNDLGVS